MGELISTLADAVIERVAVDWQSAKAIARGSDAVMLRALQDIATLAGTRGAAPAARTGGEESVSVTGFVVSVAALGAIVTAVAISSTLVRLVFADGAVPLPQLLVVLSFAGTAAVLLGVGQRAARVVDYAALSLLTAAAFSRPLLSQAAAVVPALNVAFGGVYAEVFLPAALWGFAQRFPRTYRFSPLDRMARVAGKAAALFGLSAFLINFVASARADAVHSRWTVLFLRSNPLGIFWIAFYALLFPALLCIGVRCWYADRAERRRVMIFGMAMVFGTAPIVAAGVVQVVSPAYRALMLEHSIVPRMVDAIVWIGLISIPVTTSLSVSLRGALPVRRLAADALRFVIARNSLKISSAALTVDVVARFIRERDRPLAESLHWAASYPLAAAAVLLLLFVGHRRVVRWVDEMFGRRSIDHERYAADAVVRVSAARERQAAAVVVANELRRAFDPRSVAVLVHGDGGAWAPVGSSGQPLLAESSLPWLAAASAHGASVRPGSSTFELLPINDQRWVLRNGTERVVSIGSGEPWGLVAVGSKPDSQPYDRSDQLLISTIAGAAAYAAPVSTDDAPRSGDSPALECPRCGLVSMSAKSVCGCGVEPVLAALPKTVAGKFQVGRRVGSGGMGVVYFASDRLIGRSVALKTMYVSGVDCAERVLREARAMAAAVHPNLAQIHSVELVSGAPVLVVEWMQGGTLADRLCLGCLGWRDAISVARGIADALAHLHAAGLVHQDVKPSNIAFGAEGTPKLLDFGLASAVIAPDAGSATVGELGVEGESATMSLAVAGTPLYLSPDLLAGAPGGPHQDLWALALVLYEAIAGSNPFKSDTVRTTVRKIRTLDLPDVRESAPDAPAPLALFLSEALSRDPARRPATASAMARVLSDLSTK